MLMSVLGTTAQAMERCTAIEEELHQSQVGTCAVLFSLSFGHGRRERSPSFPEQSLAAANNYFKRDLAGMQSSLPQAARSWHLLAIEIVATSCVPPFQNLLSRTGSGSFSPCDVIYEVYNSSCCLIFFLRGVCST